MLDPAALADPAIAPVAESGRVLGHPGVRVGARRGETAERWSRVLALRLREERRLARVEADLLRLAVEETSPFAVARLTAIRLGRPCTVLLPPETAASFTATGESVAWRSPLDEDARACQTVAAELAAVETGNMAVIGSYPRLGIDCRHLVARIEAGPRGALIALAEADRPLGGGDARLLGHAAAVLAIRLRADRRILEAEQWASESLVREVLQDFDTPRSVREQAARAGLDLDGPNVVCLLSGGLEVGEVRGAAESLGVTCCRHIASVRGGLAVVSPLRRSKPRHIAIARVRGELRRLLSLLERDGLVSVAIVSSTCRSARDLPAALEECRELRKWLSDSFLAQPGSRVVCADDLGPAKLLLGRLTSAAAERLVEDILGPLTERDEGAKLLETLDAFFASNHVIRVTAAGLGIHENTVRYRFRRFADATGLDLLGRVEDQLTARLALTMLKLRSNVPITKEQL